MARASVVTRERATLRSESVDGRNGAESRITRDWAALNDAIRDCERCRPELNIEGQTQSAPGYGNKSSPVALVGQSLCGPCMEPQEPFYGGCERFITAALEVHGRSKGDLFVTNIVHCHPPNNRASRTSEIENCRKYLHRELDLVAPRLVIGLGRDERAHRVLRERYPDAKPLEWWPAGPPLSPEGSDTALMFFPHPSWVKFQPEPVRSEWVTDLAAAIDWGFAVGAR